MRTLQMVTPEQDHIQELTKINPFGQKQGDLIKNNIGHIQQHIQAHKFHPS